MTITRSIDRMTPSLRRIQRDLQKTPQEVYRYWVEKTPKRSGNARRRTVLRDDTISAEYPYAERLDQGWSSQAPTGMSRPTAQFFRNNTRKKVRK